MDDWRILIHRGADIAVALLLMTSLALWEVARVSAGPRRQNLKRALTFATVPILLVFLATTVIRMVDILG